MNVKRRSISLAGLPPRGHASSASFTSSLNLNPFASGLNQFRDVPMPSFGDKMEYFRRKGSVSLIPSDQRQPAWRDRSYSAPSFLLSRPRCGGPLMLAFGFLSCIAVFLLVCNLTVSDKFHRAVNHASKSHLLKCEPYSSFGTITMNEIDPDGTSWRPYDKKCRPPNFFRRLRHRQLDGLGWLKDRTVLLIGDTIDREHVEQFCALMGSEAEVINDQHALSPVKAEARKRSKGKPQRDPSDGSWPRVCYLSHLNFTLASVYHFGLDQDDFWAQRSPLYKAPGLFEHRLAQQFQPLVQKLVAAGRAPPDLVELNSGAFDLMRFAKQDAEVHRATSEALTHERMDWYRMRTAQAMELVKAAFPLAKSFLWRSIHYPADSVAELEYYEGRKAATPTPGHFSLNRVAQLDQAARSLVAASDSGYRLDNWGTLMLGHNAHQKDALHSNPGAPETVIWAEIVLYELYLAVAA